MTAPAISKHTDYEGGAELRNPTIAVGVKQPTLKSGGIQHS
jgi:hypothetical protein